MEKEGQGEERVRGRVRARIRFRVKARVGIRSGGERTRKREVYTGNALRVHGGVVV